jgi:hypothetical protein
MCKHLHRVFRAYRSRHCYPMRKLGLATWCPSNNSFKADGFAAA